MLGIQFCAGGKGGVVWADKRNLVLLLLAVRGSGRIGGGSRVGRRSRVRVGVGGVSLLVHLLEETKGSLLGSVDSLLDLLRGDISVTSGTLGGDLSELSEELVDLVSLLLVELALELLHGLLGVSGDRLGLVGLLNDQSPLLVSLSVLLGVGHHSLNLLVGETGRRSDSHRLLLVGGLVDGRNVDDSIGVNVESDLNLGDSLGDRGKTGKLEVTEDLVVSAEFSLSLVDLDLNSGLTISGGREDLRLLGRDGGVSVDESGEDTTEGLDTERKRGNIEEQDVGDVTGQDTGLDGSTDGDGLIGVDTLGRLSAKETLDGLDDSGHSGHTTDQNDVVDLAGLNTSIRKSLLAWLDRSVDERLDERLELGSGQGGVDVLGSISGSGDVRQRDVGLRSRRQLNLGSLSGLSDSLDGHSVLLQVNAVRLLELVDDVVDENDVEIFTTQVSVTVGRLDLEHTLLHLQDGDIESATSEIVNRDHGRIRLVETVSEGGGGGLVDDSENLETGDGTSVLGSLSLRIVEVGGDSDNSMLDGLTEVCRSSVLHLTDDKGTDLGGRVGLALSLNPSVTVAVRDDLEGDVVEILLDLGVLELSSNQPLGSEQGVLGVDNSLSLGGHTNKSLTVLGECDDGGSGSTTLSVLDNSRGLTLHHGDTRVGCTQIDTDDGARHLGVHRSGEKRGGGSLECRNMYQGITG